MHIGGSDGGSRARQAIFQFPRDGKEVPCPLSLPLCRLHRLLRRHGTTTVNAPRFDTFPVFGCYSTWVSGGLFE